MDDDDAFFDRLGSINDDAGGFSLEPGNSLGLVISDLETTTDHVATAPQADYEEYDRERDESQQDEFQQDLAILDELEDGIAGHTLKDENGTLSTEELANLLQRTRVEVAIPEMPLEEQNQYVWVYSEVVEFVIAELPEKRESPEYHIELTDGIQRTVSECLIIPLVLCFCPIVCSIYETIEFLFTGKAFMPNNRSLACFDLKILLMIRAKLDLITVLCNEHYQLFTSFTFYLPPTLRSFPFYLKPHL